MHETVERVLGGIALRLVALAEQRPRLVVGTCLALTLLSGHMAATRLRVDTDPDLMTSAELPFRKTNARLEASFPQLVDNLVLLVDANAPADARAAAEELMGLLEDDEHFSSVFLPGADPFFLSYGLAYLDLAELERIVRLLEQAGPLLATQTQKPSLASFVVAMAALPSDDGSTSQPGVSPPWMESMAASLDASLAGHSQPVAWGELLAPTSEPPLPDTQTLLVQPTRDFLGFGPARDSIRAVRAAASQLDSRAGLRVRVTGDVAVLTEEMSLIRWQAAAAALASLVLVTAVLFVALHSFRLVLATLGTLLIGLVWTAGFAAVAVGHLNVLTTAFAVLYIGLGVDFGIHFAMGFRERRVLGDEPLVALRESGRIVGSSLVLCSLTTATGFFAFAPTSYTGVAELGIISGTGIFLSLLATLSFFPAVIAIGLGHSQKLPTPDRRTLGVAMPTLPLRRPRLVLGLAGMLAVVSLLALPRVRFDSDPLNVRDPRVESVRAMVDVLEPGEPSPWSIEILATNVESARALRPVLEVLPEVERVVTLDDFLPANAEAKRQLIERGRRALVATDPSPNASIGLAAALSQLQGVAARGTEGESPVTGVEALQAALLRLAERLQNGSEGLDLAVVERDLFGELNPALAALRDRLREPPTDVSELPASLAQRYLSEEGGSRLEVFASENLRAPGALERFADAVRVVSPEAGGAVVGTVEFARTVVTALRQALALALVVIALLLFAIWRSARYTVIAMVPLLLGALLTAALTAVLNFPLNFANVIVLPLILGIGVDSGIHLVHRHRLHLAEDRDILHTSTARAVLFSALTTLASFATLGFASHRGIASLAQLLTAGLLIVLICNLIVLPALLAAVEGSGGRTRSASLKAES